MKTNTHIIIKKGLALPDYISPKEEELKNLINPREYVTWITPKITPNNIPSPGVLYKNRIIDLNLEQQKIIFKSDLITFENSTEKDFMFEDEKLKIPIIPTDLYNYVTDSWKHEMERTKTESLESPAKISNNDHYFSTSMEWIVGNTPLTRIFIERLRGSPILFPKEDYPVAAKLIGNMKEEYCLLTMLAFSMIEKPVHRRPDFNMSSYFRSPDSGEKETENAKFVKWAHFVFNHYKNVVREPVHTLPSDVKLKTTSSFLEFAQRTMEEYKLNVRPSSPFPFDDCENWESVIEMSQKIFPDIEKSKVIRIVENFIYYYFEISK